MQIKFSPPAEEAAFYRLILEVLLALAKIQDKSSGDIKAVDNIEQIFYSVENNVYIRWNFIKKLIMNTNLFPPVNQIEIKEHRIIFRLSEKDFKNLDELCKKNNTKISELMRFYIKNLLKDNGY